MEEAAPAPGPSLVDQAQETMAGHMEALQTHWETYNAPPVACEDYSPFVIESVTVWKEAKVVPTGYGTQARPAATRFRRRCAGL